MDPREFVFGAFLPATVVVTGCVTFVIVVRALAKRFAGGASRQALPSAPSPADAERWQRLEQAVDAMAIEIERISEAQRFTTKLLTERAGAPAHRRTPVTPLP